MTRPWIASLLLSVLLLWMPLWSSAENLPECSGVWYRAKRDGVPIYEEPATSARVLGFLSLGQKVCYVGERGGFAFLGSQNWQMATTAFVEPTSQEAQTPKPNIAYVRLVDLWPGDEPLSSSWPQSVWREMKSLYYNMKHGGVADDALAPYRWLRGFFRTPKNEQPQQP